MACLTDIYGQRRKQQTNLQRNRANQTKQIRVKNKKIKMVKFDLCYDFFVPGKTSKIKFIVLLPRTILGRQKIFDIKYSQEPSKCFSKNRNDYAEFIFINPPKQFKVEITVKAKLFKYDLSTAIKKTRPNLDKDPNLIDFLKHERYIQNDDSQIQQIAKSITGINETNRIENTYNYVIDNMEYSGYAKDDIGAIKAIEQRKGDCSEYSDLFAALCRAKNIPARVVTGYTTEFENISKHAWAEVYLQRFGWVPFDPQRGDRKDPLVRKNKFQSMENIYVCFTHLRNDEVLNGYRYDWYYYWGDKIELKDSIKFKIK